MLIVLICSLHHIHLVRGIKQQKHNLPTGAATMQRDSNVFPIAFYNMTNFLKCMDSNKQKCKAVNTEHCCAEFKFVRLLLARLHAFHHLRANCTRKVKGGITMLILVRVESALPYKHQAVGIVDIVNQRRRTHACS